MSSVDNRVVAMKFDNKQFQAGVKDTMGSLQDLNQSLKMEGATKDSTNPHFKSKYADLASV